MANLSFQFSLHKMSSAVRNIIKRTALNTSSTLAFSAITRSEHESEQSPNYGNMKFSSGKNTFKVKVNGIPCEITCNVKNTEENPSDSEDPVIKEVNLVELMNKMADVYLESSQATETEKALIRECKKLPNVLKDELNMEVKGTECPSKSKEILGFTMTGLGGVLGMAGGAYAGSAVGGLLGKTAATIFGVIGAINGGLIGFVSVIPFLLYMDLKSFFRK